MLDRTSIIFLVAGIVALVLPILSTGCSSETVEVDQAAIYTPQSLAQELVLRYQALNGDEQKSTRGPRKTLSETAIAARDKADKKTKSRTTKKRGANTIDDVLDDIQYKMTLIRGMTPSEIAKKMTETIGAERSISDREKNNLKELVERTAG